MTTATLARFAAELRFEAVPAAVVRRAEDLLVDWFGSAIAGHGTRPVETIAAFAPAMGPEEGASEVLVGRGRSSPCFAAMVNVAASHVAEQDDVHNGSVFHPATVVFPVALAWAQALGASGKQLLTAASLARDGFTGAQQILEGPQGMAAGMSSDANASRLTDGLGTRWALAETSFKYHASCRHTHPAANALLAVMQAHDLRADDIEDVQTHVHQGAIDVLGPVVDPATVHQSKFSMGTVLALVARFGQAGLAEFDAHFDAPATRAFRDRVRMALDTEVDAAYPRRWIGKVTVRTRDGRTLHGRVDEPKGDPGNTLSRDEITAKALRLAAFSGGASEPEMRDAIGALWRVAALPKVGPLLGAKA